MSLASAVRAFFEGLRRSDPHPSLVVDVEAGEWRCGCPSVQGFNTSINPRWVKACSRCGRQRPENA